MKTVAITGAEGNIGSRLRDNLAGKYELRLISLKPIAGEEAIIVNIADGVEALIPAFKGVDSVVHLAASPAVDTPWDSVLHNNIIGTYNVFEAARQAGVKQLIFASSNHAVGTYEQEFEPGPNRPNDKVIDELVPIRPDSLYGVSKVFGEALGRYYADHLGMHVISLRIGWITPTNKPEGGNLAEPGVTMWQSHEDFAQMVEKCLEADDIQFDIFYGISDNPFHFFDIEHARQEIGYQPRIVPWKRCTRPQTRSKALRWRRDSRPFLLTPGGIRNTLAHMRLLPLMHHYHAQSTAMGQVCVIQVTPEQAEFLTQSF